MATECAMEYLSDEGEFDKELGLGELIDSRMGRQLTGILNALIGAPVRVVDPQGTILIGSPEGTLAHRISVRGLLEPAGYIETDGDPERAEGAARALELLLKSEARYRMASRLHLSAVRSDYEELKQKHQALAESEARYRELAAKLDERVQAQVKTIESAQRQLYQTEKMAAVGQLAAGIAHEINNPIGFIRSNLNTALHYRDQLAKYIDAAGNKPDDVRFALGDLRDLLEESIDGAERVARIVAAFKDFSRVDRPAMEPADLNVLVRSVCEVLTPQAGGRVQMVQDLAPLPPIHCHAGNLGQVFYNLLTNAIQSVDKKGVVRVSTRVIDGAVRIVVEDNGSGIAPEHLPRIFEPFFTTKPVGKGTGLGLTVSNDVVRAHGGRIDVESRAGVGTRMMVTLPLQPAQEAG